ncbi:hypothetical protein AB5I41_28215 [Sphingomonas sp. MMS24-JH45]
MAGYLAEDAAHAALAEARRFEEFNRRFAFLFHDLKNLVSQMALVARNAERHADNPDFRADMIATLRDTSQRMSTILARLTQTPAGSGRPRHGRPARAGGADRRRAPRAASDPRHRRARPCDGDPGGAGNRDRPCLDSRNPDGASAPGVRHAGGGRGQFRGSDRGAGMTPAFVRDELFKPFVSGKANGFGLGARRARSSPRWADGWRWKAAKGRGRATASSCRHRHGWRRRRDREQTRSAGRRRRRTATPAALGL